MLIVCPSKVENALANRINSSNFMNYQQKTVPIKNKNIVEMDEDDDMEGMASSSDNTPKTAEAKKKEKYTVLKNETFFVK